ncbi:hypothetical protein NIES4106_01510 [Fischerella sp. NIES-4106]|nr:hypothetical protein NIES4106_01510 [Fischerella sp. NIES-4106]
MAISRQQFQEKLQQYEKAFTNALHQQPAISESDLNALRQNLQQILELRNEDTLPIEAQITASIEAYKQHLLQYEQALADTMRQEYPLSQITRRRFQQMQQEWQLIEADVAAIESRVSAEIEAYRQKLKQYEQTFTRVTRQEYPLSQNKRNELLQQQQNLALHYQDIASIEGRIIAEIEAYRQKLQQYEQAFITATQQEYPLSDAKRNELLQQRQILGLNQENIASIEARIIAEIEAYRQKLKQYEQIFTRVTRLEYPLSDAKRNELQKEQQNLGLNNQDIISIEARIITEIQAYQKKLQQYEQVLTQVIQHEYPFKEEVREELRRFQKVLELNNEEVAKIEEQVLRQKETNQQSSNSQHSDNNNINLSKSDYSQKTEVIPENEQSQLVITVPLQFVMFIAGLFGTLWMLNGGIFGNEENEPRIPTINNNTPSVTLKPSVGPSQPSDRPDVIQTTTDLELFTNTSSPQQAIAPAGTVLKIIKSKVTTTQEQNSDESIFLRICSVGEDITPPTNPPDPLTPITRKPKPVVKEGKVYTIKLSEYQKLLNDSSTSLPEVVTQCQQEPQPTPPTTP